MLSILFLVSPNFEREKDYKSEEKKWVTFQFIYIEKSLKGTVHPKITISFHPNLSANLYDFPYSAEHMNKDMKN